MLYRWLLSVVAALAVLTGSVSAFAAAGIVGDPTCCCPDPDTCKCHDHDGEHAPAPIMKKCGGESHVITPHAAAATVVPSPPRVTPLRASTTIEYDTLPMPPMRDERPETPPF